MLAATGPGAAAALPQPTLAETSRSLSQAEVLIGQERFSAAEALLRRELARHPDPELRYFLGFTLLQLYRYDEAQAAFERAIAEEGDVSSWHQALAKSQ